MIMSAFYSLKQNTFFLRPQIPDLHEYEKME
jgi:hypothetical protein